MLHCNIEDKVLFIRELFIFRYLSNFVITFFCLIIYIYIYIYHSVIQFIMNN